MNRTKIEWADHTWNPITGCYHTCPYCYARNMTRRFAGDVRQNLKDERCKGDKDRGLFVLDEPFISRNNRSLAYPFDFAPTFHTYRLDWPQKVKNGANIFVCSMADMFGEWVPDEWIKQIFKACEEAPQHNYLFLTKNPQRYVELERKGILPTGKNFWYGSSAPTPETEFFWNKDVNTFVSIEPILSPFNNLTDNGSVIKKTDWILIGAETGNRKEKVKPEASWIAEIVKAADMVGIPVFMKDSLVDVVGEENMRRDFPCQLAQSALPLSEKTQNKLYDKCGFCGKKLKKSDATALLTREKRGAAAVKLGYACTDCLKTLKDNINKTIGGKDNENS